jgi:hypothetical protein
MMKVQSGLDVQITKSAWSLQYESSHSPVMLALVDDDLGARRAMAISARKTPFCVHCELRTAQVPQLQAPKTLYLLFITDRVPRESLLVGPAYD